MKKSGEKGEIKNHLRGFKKAYRTGSAELLDFVIKYSPEVEQGMPLAKIIKGVNDMPNQDSNILSPELSHTI